VVDRESVDGNRKRLLASISTFCLFVEIVSNEKERRKSVSEPIPHFGNNVFSESNKKVQCIAYINIREPIPHFTNNVAIFGNNSIGPLSINVGPVEDYDVDET